jgi:hypothetical protein
MKRITFAFLAGVLLLASGCRWGGVRGNGHVTTEQRNINTFSELQANGGFKIEWRAGAPSLSITTDENLLPYIETQNVDNRLLLRSRQNLWSTHGIKVVVSSPTRLAAKFEGAADLTANALSGSRFAVQSSGAADIRLDGAVDELLVDMTGATDLRAKDLQAKTVQISATGAADVTISVSETLRVTVTGAGDVKYYGNPPTIEKHVTGAGSIRHKD